MFIQTGLEITDQPSLPQVWKRSSAPETAAAVKGLTTTFVFFSLSAPTVLQAPSRFFFFCSLCLDFQTPPFHFEIEVQLILPCPTALQIHTPFAAGIRYPRSWTPDFTSPNRSAMGVCSSRWGPITCWGQINGAKESWFAQESKKLLSPLYKRRTERHDRSYSQISNWPRVAYQEASSDYRSPSS